MSMVKSGIIKRSLCKSNAVSRVSVGQDKFFRARGNCEISEVADVKDQGQIPKLLARLEGLGLLVNTGGSTAGIPNAWRLTPHGQEIVRVGQSSSGRTNGGPNGPVEDAR